jgi:hypothetical protein
MYPKFWALLLCVGCGAVKNDAPAADGAVVGDDAPAPPVSYTGKIDKTPIVTFGGGAPPPTCTYTMSLQDMTVDLGIRPTGEIVTGRIQNVNVEGLVAACMYSAAGPVVAGYMLDTAIPSGGSVALSFKNDPTNATKVALSAAVAPNTGGYAIMMTFQRTDQVALLDWKVVAALSLAVKK